MRVSIDHLLELWDAEDLGSLKLTMLVNAVKDSQVYQLEEGKDIQRQTECTKDYLLKLKGNATEAFIDYNEKLIAILKRVRPNEHRGIYGYASLDAVDRMLTEYELMAPYTKKERSVIALSNVGDKANGGIIEGQPVSAASVRALKKTLGGAVMVEYRLSERGVLLVCSNRMEDSRLKWYTMKAMEAFDGVRAQAVVNAKAAEALPKIEVLNLINHYRTSQPRIVVILPGVSEYAEKEIVNFDRFAKIVSPPGSIIDTESARTEFLALVTDLYKSGYTDAAKPYDPTIDGNRMEMNEEDKKIFLDTLRKLDADYSHQKYINLCYELVTMYRQFNTSVISGQLEKVREKKELTEGKY